MNDPILNDSGMTELHLAAYHGEFDWVQSCVNGELNVNSQDEGGFTPLHWVVDMGMVGPDGDERERIIQLLIDSAADINAVNGMGESVFHRVVIAGNPKLVRLLIDNKADTEIRDHQGVSAHDYAASNENLELIKLIERARNDASKKFQ